MVERTYPSVTLGAGRWQAVVRILRRQGTKEAAQLAAQIEKQVNE